MKKISNSDFEKEYQNQDNKNIIYAATKKYSGILSPDEQKSCGLSGLWRCMQNHNPKYGRKFTTSLYMHVTWECKRAISQINKNNFKSMSGIEKEIPSKDNGNFFMETVDGLTPKQADIIHKRFIENQTLKEIGEEYGYTKESARQDVNKAIKKIRSIT